MLDISVNTIMSEFKEIVGGLVVCLLIITQNKSNLSA